MRGAGGGRPRNPDGQVRHRNPPTKGSILIDADARVENPPDPTLKFTGLQREIWDLLWSTPVATLWDHVDVPALTRLVLLQTSKAALLDAKVLGELRQLEDRFLLNPYARTQQRVIIGTGDDNDESDGANVSWIDDARRRLDGTG